MTTITTQAQLDALAPQITGIAAIEYARRTGAALRKHADPIEGARGVSLTEAEAIAREDPGLIYCEASS